MIELRIEGNARSFHPGDDIRGTVSWNEPEALESVTVTLLYFTSGKGTQDVVNVRSEDFESVGRSGSRNFSFRLPDQPYSFSGKLISLSWAVEAVADPSEETARQEFVVSPTGSAIVLSADAADSPSDSVESPEDFKDELESLIRPKGNRPGSKNSQS